MSKDNSYKKIVEKALMAEYDEKEIDKERQFRRQKFVQKGQASVQGGKGGHQGKRKKEYCGKAPAVPSESNKPLCPKCHKPHKGECLVGSKKCYRCVVVEHIAINCTQSLGKGRVQGRIFSLTKEGVNPDSSIISGTILISGKVATTLIDTSATHSFISEQFMHSLGLAPIDEELFNVDLIVIPIEFDVILGMDWLSTYRAMIDCVAKTVHFPSGHGNSRVFTGLGTLLGLSFISCLQMQHMLVKGCHGFLASVVDITREGSGNVSDIDIVRDYLDVFADDVPGLPQDREVEFVIDIVPGYYRRFIADFSKIALPLTTLTRKTVKFQWTNECQQAFQVLKDKLTSALVLALPHGVEDFVVYTCASKKGLGAMLMQRGKRSEIGLVEEAEKKGNSEFGLNNDGLITFQGRICVLVGDAIRRDVLTEAHTAPYSVKIEHKQPAGLLQYLPIPQWKWEHITMDFVVGLPRTQKGYNSIWVIVDRLTKSSHFLPVKTTYSMTQYAETYVQEIVRLHGIPVSIVLDRDTRFTSEFWKRERKMLGTELVQQMVDVVALIRQRMKTAQSRQTSYANVRRRPLEFNVGDQVFVKIAPLKGVIRFEKKGKLSPRYIGPFEILDMIGESAYRLALPPDLDRVHNVFHVSMLRKYLSNPSHVLRHEALDLLPNLSCEELPVQIIYRKVKVLRNKEIGFVKVLWRNHVIEEATWEPEEEMRQGYPDLF
ncbi:uncharacterized protein LOC142519676 [Primulina tabacum]|uniref:uncharacterized protein LOC142519676 n=1 Tax=Primulina tabacum TaxID=48773 RepID=UPI003F5A0C2C